MKKSRLFILLTITILAILSFPGCIPAGSEENVSTPEPSLEFDDNIVSALGEVVPEQWVNLSFPSGGYQLDMLVSTGEDVTIGKLLASVNDAAQQAALANARSAVSSALANLGRLEDAEADDQDIDVANKAVAAAQASLASAQANLEATQVRAPFSGTVVEIFIKDDEAAAPNQPVILLANLDNWLINTTDLSEVDVARVQIGDPAKIVFDALPDVSVTGRVIQIALRPEQGAGIYYTVTLQLDEIPENLRWGMSAFVEIEVSR